ncbi:MAG: DUF2029 domain-containing protein [Acidobacteriia bacterium]|nr:DUF2029 domain-containing protein [Terriglobia bacterium]
MDYLPPVNASLYETFTTVFDLRKAISMRKAAIWLILTALAVVMASNYLTGALLPVFKPSGSDFSELYVASWLWRHGHNAYDSAIATAAHQQVVGASEEIFLVNVPTSLVLAAPLTLLSWGWANFVFLTSAVIGLVATTFAILRLQGRSSWGIETALVIVFLLSFSPVRIAFQWGNIVLLVLPLSVMTILLEEKRHDWQAGVLLGLAVCLKPQIGMWLGIYYLVRARFQIVAASLAVGSFIAALFFLHPVPYHEWLLSYRANLQHWFDPGGPYGFTEGSLSFILLRTQGVLYTITHRAFISSLLAYGLFLICAGIWGILIWRSGARVPSSLAITALIAASFLSFYHSIPDVSVLSIALCDAFPASLQGWKRTQQWICFLLFLIMLPQRSIFVLLSHRLGSSILTSWWWNLFFLRYMVWLLLALSLALLLRMREAATSIKPDLVEENRS